MPTFQHNCNLSKASLLATLLLFSAGAATRAFAQENTSGDSITPLVYGVENTGANYAKPVFPTFS